MRVQSGQLVMLGYGKYVRSDEVVAVKPITDRRGPGRRCLVWVRGVPDPFVSSRSQSAIVADLMRPSESVDRGAAKAAAGVALRAARKPARKPAERPARKPRAKSGRRS